MSTPERTPGAELGFEGDAFAPAGAFVARAVRLAWVTFGFAYFGVGIWLHGVLVLPLVAFVARLRGLSPDATSRRTQRAVHRFFRSFIGYMARVSRIAGFEWAGLEALTRGPALIVANHPSLIDTPLLGSKLPQADFLVGPEWMRNGFMRRAIEAAGYIAAENGAAVVRLATERLRAGRTVVIYPEGSRSPADGLRPFQRGAAHIALESGCDILPVTLHVTPRVLMKGQPWTAYPTENPVWRVEVGEPIRTAAFAGESRALAARRLTALLEDHFQKRCVRGRS
jgi:1-acyl-sn-glycerol-3-phosphate acyltransferase